MPAVAHKERPQAYSSGLEDSRDGFDLAFDLVFTDILVLRLEKRRESLPVELIRLVLIWL